MITLSATGSNPRTSQYWHTKATVVASKSLSSLTGDCCYCSCDTELPVFAYLTDGNDKYKNDISSFLIKVPTDSTVTATLTHQTTGTAYVLTDNTYGFYYGVGQLKDDVFGFIVQWYSVADAIGFGDYVMNLTVENSNGDEIMNRDYPRFRLMPYSCESAHNTVRIESWNSGYIEGGFDYRDISIYNPFSTADTATRKLPYWIQQIRYYGRLEIVKLPTIIDNHWDNNRNLTQVQTQIQRGWNLRLDFMKSDVSNQVIYDNLLADFSLVSDYNADALEAYRDVKLSLESVDDPQPFLNKSSIFNIKFVDYKQDLLKRNY